MQHQGAKVLSTTDQVFDVVVCCRANNIDEREILKLLKLVGRFASRLEIQMNLTKKPTRCR